MRTNLPLRLPVLAFVALMFFSVTGFSQQTLTTINGWNAYVHLPDDYNSTGSQTYPLIIFFPGTGEVGTNASLVLNYGPGHFIASGWNGNVVVNGVTVKPIIISLQPPAIWPRLADVDQRIQTIKSMYRIDLNRITLTGLSMGGWISELYVESFPTAIASVVALQAVRPDDNPAYPAPFATYAQDCGHWLGYEQVNDPRDMSTIYNTMNAAKPGSATYFLTNVGGGGHCCWNTWYDPTHTDNYSLNGVTGNWSIYQYALTWNRSSCSGNVAPTVNAGAAQTITLPVSTVTLTGIATGNNGATISSVSWSKVSGGAAVIVSVSNLATVVTGLVAGTYTFKLTATDNHGLSSSSNVTITVNSPLSNNTPPSVSAGSSQTITLTGGSSGGGGSSSQSAYFNFSNAAVSVSGWTNMHGSPNNAVVTASANGITLSSVSTANWAPYIGATSFNGNGVNAAGFFGNANISVNNWYQYGDPGNYNASKPQLQATGLNASTTYTVKISGSNQYGFDTNPVRYTISGASSYSPIDVNETSTADNGATFTNVQPDANGRLNIYLNTVSGSSNAATIDGIQIISNGSSTSSTQSVSQTTATVTLSGSATGTNGASIQTTTWSQTSGTTTSITSPNSLVTTVTGLVAGVYAYKLTAIDNHGLSSTSTVTVTVNSGTTSSGNQSIQVNLYGGTNPYNNAAWNNWNVAAGVSGAITSSAFKYSDGTASPVTATLSSETGVVDNGAKYSGNIVPAEVNRYASYSSNKRTLTISNIPVSTVATLQIFGSSYTTGNTSIYTVNGISKSLITDFNMKNAAVFTNVPVTNGQIVITVDKNGTFNYINGFSLSSGGTSTNDAVITETTATDMTMEAAPVATLEKLSVYPNPFRDVVNIKWNSQYTGNASISVFAVDGRVITTKNIVKDQQEYNDIISLNSVSKGLYIVQVRLQNGKSFVEKIIKE